ncbi:unnamed protein product, partial [Choristocarpus tenellus]
LHQQLFITNTDVGMVSAVEDGIPQMTHLYCLWHMMKNPKKNCQDSNH